MSVLLDLFSDSKLTDNIERRKPDHVQGPMSNVQSLVDVVQMDIGRSYEPADRDRDNLRLITDVQSLGG